MKDIVLNKIYEMKQEGLKEKDVAKFFGYEETIDLRRMISSRNRCNRIVLASKALELKDSGKTVKEIAEELGYNESSIRLLLDNNPIIDLSKTEAMRS